MIVDSRQVKGNSSQSAKCFQELLSVSGCLVFTKAMWLECFSFLEFYTTSQSLSF